MLGDRQGIGLVLMFPRRNVLLVQPLLGGYMHSWGLPEKRLGLLLFLARTRVTKIGI